MSNPLVSIVIPLFNVEQYIKKAIESVINQSYDNIEVIVVNDGSKDNSVLLAESLLKKSGRKYSILAQENKGLASARNKGLDQSTGTYLCFIDADDVIDTNHVKNSVMALEQYKECICYSDFEYTRVNNRYGNKTFSKGTEFFARDELLDRFSKRKIRIHCCSLLFNRRMLTESNIRFNEKLRFGEDVEFMARLFPSVTGIVHVQQNSYKYLIREGSIMNSSDENNWKCFVTVFQTTIKSLQDRYKEDKEIFDILYYRTIIGLSRVIAQNTSFETYKRLTGGFKKKKIQNVLHRACDWKVKIFASIIRYDGAFYILNHYLI